MMEQQIEAGPISAGYYVAGWEYITVSGAPNDGTAGATFSADLTVPDGATDAVAFLAGWTLQYTDGDHHVKEVFVAVNPLEKDQSGALPSTVSGTVLLCDKNGDDAWSYDVNIQVLYFSPYWT